ncbi:hypothetical protein B1218_38020, partial [Pseudomonas ogarae]
VFAVHQRPVTRARGYYRVHMRPGVSCVPSGRRHTSGIISPAAPPCHSAHIGPVRRPGAPPAPPERAARRAGARAARLRPALA